MGALQLVRVATGMRAVLPVLPSCGADPFATPEWSVRLRARRSGARA